MKSMLKTVLLLSISLAAAQNCNLVVPTAPLSANGLASYWLLSTATGSPAPCSVTSFGGSVFVEATIFDPAKNTFSAYYPLVINAPANAEASPSNTAAAATATIPTGVNGYPGGPALPPVTPNLPNGAIVGIWIGGNNGNTYLIATGTGAASSLVTGNCVNGVSATDVFGEYAYCNAVNFWNAVNTALKNKAIALPPRGTTVKGVPCPTVRSFSIVDQDQSDNVITYQLIVDTVVMNANTNAITTNIGLQVAQDTFVNRFTKNLNILTISDNASDNLLCYVTQQYLGCANFILVPNLADGGAQGAALVTTQALQELVALSEPDAQIALVPATDPMTQTMVNGVPTPNLTKQNLYRAGVNQTPAAALSTADNAAYCTNLATATPMFLAQHSEVLAAAPSLVPAVGSNMLNLLAARYIASFTNLGCPNLIPNFKQLVTVTTNLDNVVVSNNLLTLFPQFTTTTKILKLPTAQPQPAGPGAGPDANDPNAGAAAGGVAGQGAAGAGMGAQNAAFNGTGSITNAAVTAPIALIAGVAGAAVGVLLLAFVALFAFGVISFRKPTTTSRV